MSYPNLEGIERHYGGPNGYGHRGFRRSVRGLWDRASTPKRTPFPQLALRLGLRSLGASSHAVRNAVMAAGGPQIFDQGQTSSCTGNAKAGSVMARFVVAGNASPYRLSPACLYKIGRRIDIPPNADGSLVPLTDDGAIPEQVTRALSEWGVCSYDDDPTDPATINKDPSLGELEHALALVTRGIYGITGDIETQVRAAIDGGFPVDIGVLVDDVLENWSGGDPIPAPNPSRILGGHALYVVDYDQLASGEYEYVFVNSWSSSWGESGMGRASAAWMQQASDVEVCDVNHNGAPQ